MLIAVFLLTLRLAFVAALLVALIISRLPEFNSSSVRRMICGQKFAQLFSRTLLFLGALLNARAAQLIMLSARLILQSGSQLLLLRL